MSNIEPKSQWEEANLGLYSDGASSAISKSAKAGRNGLPSDNSVEQLILDDIVRKISQKADQSILDVGCGCGPLSDLLIEHCVSSGHSLTMMDQDAVISEIRESSKNSHKVNLVSGIFPYDSNLLGEKQFDTIVLYGVIHLVSDPVSFVSTLIQFLKPAGYLLIGDIPNSDKKRRFLSTSEGVKTEQEYKSKFTPNNMMAGVELTPTVNFNDSFVLYLLGLFRNIGCESFLLPQPTGLPLCFTREDLLVVKNF
jgi:2-polyprenyl-3-methyl-5-hydroxy-6-metoxy-1,4-benzoquinol methylase